MHCFLCAGQEKQLHTDRGSTGGHAHKVRRVCVLVFGGCGCGWGWGCGCGCGCGCGYGCGYGCVRENQLQADRGSIEGLAHKVRHECVLVFGGCGWGMGVCVRRCVHVGVCLRVAIPISNSNCEAEASAWVASFFYLR